jgi:hypothetical protein
MRLEFCDAFMSSQSGHLNYTRNFMLRDIFFCNITDYHIFSHLCEYSTIGAILFFVSRLIRQPALRIRAD